MRRVGWVVMVAGMGLTGCGSFRDVFTSHAETAARVGARELKSARVAEIIGKLGGPNANPQAAELVTGIWVDMSLFGDRIAAKTLKTDSATMQRMMWPEIAQQKVSVWHDSILARRAGVSPAMADSAFNAGDLRLFQHILFTPSGTTAADSAKAKTLADKVLPQARTGDFGKLAAQYSGDGSKADKGFLFVAGKNAYVPEFENAAWTLAPGAVSGVVKSQFGYHIIRRPTLDESRDRFLAKLKEVKSAQQDSAYLAELSTQEKLEVKSGAPAAVKAAVADMGSARTSKKELASYRGGSFTVADLARWITALPVQALTSIKSADDSLLIPFIKTVAQNEILYKQADSAKIQVNPTVMQAMALQLQTQVNGLKESIGLDGPEFSDSSKTPVAERRKLAGEKVDQYFDKLVGGQVQFRPIPPTMSAELRTGGDYKIFSAGVNRAIEMIIAKKKADSASGVASAAPRPGSLQPAPGGPPTPSQPADTGKRP